MAGYSGTPLPQKLGLKPGLRTLLVAPPPDIDRLLVGAPAIDRLARLAPFDFALAFVTARAALVRELDRLPPKLADTGMIWIAWPKKASGVVTDVSEDVVRCEALGRGLVDVKVCAIDATWAALKLVRRVALRAKNRG
jgi:hypothetical protein